MGWEQIPERVKRIWRPPGKILTEKGVTFQNISPDPENAFYQDFISEILGYPITYVVDKEGNIIGAPIIGNLENQMDVLQKRIDTILSEK